MTLTSSLAANSHAQFVWPSANEHEHRPDVYREDPFIIKYRQEFFAVFNGDFKRFNKAYKEIQEMVKKNPKDARATVWLGNGQTVIAGLNKSKAPTLLAESRATLDRAVSLSPKDPNIYMMRAATLYIQGQYFPKEQLPKKVWEDMRDDCNNFIQYIGPVRMPQMSRHVRSETYAELGIAYKNLGDKDKAAAAFRMVKKLNPDSEYAKRAAKEIAELGLPQ